MLVTHFKRRIHRNKVNILETKLKLRLMLILTAHTSDDSMLTTHTSDDSMLTAHTSDDSMLRFVLEYIAGTVLLLACGDSIPQPVITSDNQAIIRFVSNERDQQPGFSLNYQASIEGTNHY